MSEQGIAKTLLEMADLFVAGKGEFYRHNVGALEACLMGLSVELDDTRSRLAAAESERDALKEEGTRRALTILRQDEEIDRSRKRILCDAAEIERLWRENEQLRKLTKPFTSAWDDDAAAGGGLGGDGER